MCPCKGCGERSATCHDSCAAFILWHEEEKKRREELKNSILRSQDAVFRMSYPSAGANRKKRKK